MPASAIDSLVFRNMFGSAEMREVWSDEFRTQRYLDWEAALARAQASLGLIPRTLRPRSPVSARSRTSTSSATRRRR